MNSTKGFIVDSPNALIIGKSGNSQIVTATQGSITFGGDSIDINGGWSLYSLASIDTSKTIEIALTDAELKMSSLALQNGVTVQSKAKERFIFGQNYEVKANKITLPYEVVAGSVLIEGFEETGAILEAGKFTVTVGTGTTDIEFFAGELADGSVISPIFRVEIADTETVEVLNNSFAGTSKFILEYPVYGDKDDETTLLGYVQFVVFKAKISANFAVEGSYKSASTFELTATGQDARRPDKKIFEVNFFKA